ncbi:DUF600 domain-containing protein [Aneurinibacillus danicus]|uniref:DUF600 domain-containing protein n=1 Tax=Aneurinibacillus danicus TaxID=267746 RepID=A0A511VBE5_9BACL|nr:DUF600 domain-containing protein [Aneurinibacillus danicus]GEN34883.1 hypothetical protein ADA01nite_23430 [Aneurinibacillus danicus]
MAKVFEDYFSELQADMVSICLEYVNNRADVIYIYASYELGEYGVDVFYKINNCVVQKHKLNDAVQRFGDKSEYLYDVSRDRQIAMLDIANENLRKIYDLCRELNREMPTEMKLVYDVANNKLDATYSYDLKYSNDPEKISSHIFDEWFVEMGGKL